jgi:glutamate-1-semialdehyde 2,1-aminomutase
MEDEVPDIAQETETQPRAELLDDQEAGRRLEAAGREILAQLPKTVEVFERAHRVVPGGFTRARFFWPLPICIDRGDGPYVFDVDGRRYIDCLLGFGTMILGHRPPEVIEAVQLQLGRGTQFGTAVASESELASIIVEHVPGAEQVIFVNSGTEATLGALRIARAATGRTKVAKFEGGWHGWNDHLLQSFFRYAGPAEHPETLPGSLGIPPAISEDVLTLPFNHPAAFELIRTHARELACVILEGLEGSAGCLVADSEWAQELKRTCEQCGVLLIMDEVITGFRMGPSGIAGKLGVQADLTTLGKTIGGGFPVGAICGRRELVETILPNNDGDQVLLAGTFSANPVTTVAGIAQLNALLGDPEAYERLDALGERMREGIRQVLAELDVQGAVAGAGSIWGVHLKTDVEPRTVRESCGPGELGGIALTGYLLREGVLMEAPCYLGFVSTVHTAELVDEAIAAHRTALTKMKQDGIVG